MAALGKPSVYSKFELNRTKIRRLPKSEIFYAVFFLCFNLISALPDVLILCFETH